MKLGFGSDHAGFKLKEILKEYMDKLGYECVDYGTYSEERVDYPDFGEKVGLAVTNKEIDFGILVCGSGIGISIVANKVKGVRAALCSDPYSAKLARLHNDANVVAVGARLIGEDMAKKIVENFVTGEFEGGRHCGRIDKISKIEDKNI